MDKAGWPAIPFDGQLLVSHQDALLMGGKVQAPHGYADHVVFLHPELCEKCGARICIEACSGQAIYSRRNRRADFRPREMRPLRRVPVELLAGEPGKSRAHEHRLPRRHRRLAFGGELKHRSAQMKHREMTVKLPDESFPKSVLYPCCHLWPKRL